MFGKKKIVKAAFQIYVHCDDCGRNMHTHFGQSKVCTGCGNFKTLRLVVGRHVYEIGMFGKSSSYFERKEDYREVALEHTA